MDVIVAELREVRQLFADERRTEIEGEATDYSTEDLIAEEEMVVTVSHAGYVKRNPVSLYRAQRRGGRGKTGAATRDEDFVEATSSSPRPTATCSSSPTRAGCTGSRSTRSRMAGRAARGQADREPRAALAGREGRGDPAGAAAPRAGRERRGGRRGRDGGRGGRRGRRARRGRAVRVHGDAPRPHQEDPARAVLPPARRRASSRSASRTATSSSPRGSPTGRATCSSPPRRASRSASRSPTSGRWAAPPTA